MRVFRIAIVICASSFFLSASCLAETQIRPGMVGGTPPPNAPNPPQNPSQSASPSAPGVILTYPNNPPTKVGCSRDGKPVDC
jgi:hypothetical protein